VEACKYLEPRRDYQVPQPEYHPGGTFLSGAARRAQGDAEHSLVTVERVHLYALGAAAWGEAVLGDGGTIITQGFDRYPVVRMQSAPVDAHGKVS
jgi:hypothetical protein